MGQAQLCYLVYPPKINKKLYFYNNEPMLTSTLAAGIVPDAFA